VGREIVAALQRHQIAAYQLSRPAIITGTQYLITQGFLTTIITLTSSSKFRISCWSISNSINEEGHRFASQLPILLPQPIMQPPIMPPHIRRIRNTSLTMQNTIPKHKMLRSKYLKLNPKLPFAIRIKKYFYFALFCWTFQNSITRWKTF
jgi:hypothetical protein